MPPSGLLKMDSYSCPPWSAASEEAAGSDPAMFSACLDAIGLIASRMNGAILERTCSMSKQWGKVVRAKITYQREGSAGSAFVTCWSAAGSGVEIAVKLDCDQL
jgi:hypothetical protein